MQTDYDWLQRFAEGAEGTQGTEGAEGANEGASKGSTQESENTEGKNQKLYTDEDIDAIIARRFAKWEKQKKKEIDEAKRLENMNAQERAEHERDELQRQLSDLLNEKALADMSKTARKMLSDSGITLSDDLLQILVSTDADATKTAVDNFSKLFSDAVDAAVKERLKGNPPKRGASSGSTITKEEIMKIRDPELRQKKMLENRELFGI